MTRIALLLAGVTLATGTLATSTAATAQLIGGGGGLGGLSGGAMGGGMVGGMTNMGTSAVGSTRGMAGSDSLRSMTRAERLEARQLRADQRAARRETNAPASSPMTAVTSGSLAASGTRSVGVDRDGRSITGTGTGSVVASGSRSVPVDRDGRSIASTGRTADAGTITGRIDQSARFERPSRLGIRELTLRRDAAFVARGLRRAGRTASGVSVFVPPAAVALVPVGAGGGAYPVYAGGYGGDFYGGSTVVVASGDREAYMDRNYDQLRDDVADSGVTVERRGNDIVLQLPADITFAFDRADIQPRFVPALDAVARTIADYEGTEVEIVGHTDAVGSDTYNYALSQRRGVSVADFLVARAAEPTRLVVAAMGESAPIESNATIAGRAANRRVEIILHPRTS